MLLHDDVMHQILLWLPVIYLLQFKHVCKSWRALIESSHFIKQHLGLHHYDSSLKDKNHNLIYLVPGGKDSFITFPLTSIESFEEPNGCLQLNCPDLHGNFLPIILEIASYNGIICLDLFNCKGERRICLWNPATTQLRVLPQSSFLNQAPTTIGFGFDVKNNDYKVVNFTKVGYTEEKRVEVYSLNMSSWRSVTTVFPFTSFCGNPRMPFNDGTCFFWFGFGSTFENEGIICFDFSSEMFRSISLPHASYILLLDRVSVIHDKIACLFSRMNDDRIETWVLNDYGGVNESWAKLYTMDLYSTIGRHSTIGWLSMNGNYIFFTRMGQMCRFNVVTQETKNLSTTLEKGMEIFSIYLKMVEFKESLVSVGEGNRAPNDIKKDSGKVENREMITN